MPSMLQPEVCTNVACTMPEVFQRTDTARHSQLHTLVALPLWLPAVSSVAPVAVLEALSPEPPLVFEWVCAQVRPAV